MLRSLIAVLTLVFALSGCEIVASFDRDKILPAALMRPDGSFIPIPGDGEPTDGGPSDAGPDASMADGSLFDASRDGGLPEASLEGGTDAQVGDGSTAGDGAPAEGSAGDAAKRAL